MKYIFLSLISALLLSVSWPVYGVPFFIFIALVPLLVLEHDIIKFSKIKHKGWAVFGLSYLCFVVWNIISTGWLYGSKNPDGSQSLQAVAFPVLVNSLLYSIVFQLYSVYKKVQGTYWGLVFFVAIWLSFEKFHLSWELSWPWLNLGNVFSEYPKLIQWYDTVGATGGSLWILLANVLVFYTLRIWEAGRSRKALVKHIAILGVLISVPVVVSLFKYYSFDEKPIGEVKVVMIQPALDPYTEKYTKDSLSILKDIMELAHTADAAKVDYYLAPETAVPGYGSLSEKGFHQSRLIGEIKGFLEAHSHSAFVSGASTHQFFFSNENLPPSAYQIQAQPEVWVENYNTALQIIPKEEVQTYHKAKLVPGVEIFPYMKTLKPLLGDAMLNLGGTVASLGTDEKRKVFRNPYNKGAIAPVICYESIYGEFVTDYVKNGANFLGILTNDSWWGETQGYKQLLSYARLRAIETRREIARVANSGVSAHINALGEIEESTFYGDKTALYSAIKLYQGETFYTRAGDFISRIAIFSIGFLVFYTLLDKYQNRKKKK